MCSDWWGAMAEEVLAKEGLAYEKWQRTGMRESHCCLGLLPLSWPFDLPGCSVDVHALLCLALPCGVRCTAAERGDWALLRDTCITIAPTVQKRPARRLS